MADSGAELRSFIGGVFQENSFALAGVEVFLYYYVHGVERVEHLRRRVHDSFVDLGLERAAKVEFTRRCAS